MPVLDADRLSAHTRENRQRDEVAAAVRPDFDSERFEGLVLFIAHSRRHDPRFGRTKLAKSLFYSDFDAYRDQGQPLTGASYIRMPFGPFPRELDSTERAL